MQRYRFAACFCLLIPKVVAHARTGDSNFHREEVDITPSEREKFGTTKASAASCGERHDQDEMLYCVECDGRYCLYCSCNCVPLAAEELTEMELLDR